MDMQKIGGFLKQLRKEKGLTQEQFAEVLGVAGRSVSRWENASNMPDLSLLIQIAEFYDVEIKEILDGERKREHADNELKETLANLADYSKAEKEKIAKISMTAFLVTILVGAAALLAQLVLFMDIRYIIGEAVMLFVGGVTAVVLVVRGGLWDAMSKENATVKSDIAVSAVMSAVFTLALGFLVYRMSGDISKTVICAAGFLVCICVIGFLVLRMLFALSRKRKREK